MLGWWRDRGRHVQSGDTERESAGTASAPQPWRGTTRREDRLAANRITDRRRFPRLRLLALTGLYAVALTLVGIAGWRADYDRAPTTLALLLAACSLVTMETLRRSNASGGPRWRPHADMQGAWVVAAVTMVPLIYALAIIVIQQAVRLLSRPARRASGLPATPAVRIIAAVAAWLVLRGVWGHPIGWQTLHMHPIAVSFTVVAAGVCSPLLGMASGLCGSLLKQGRLDMGWLYRNQETYLLDLAESSGALVMVAVAAVQPVMLLFGLPALLVLQRGFVHRDLRSSARTDLKTGLLNARAFVDSADRELAFARRHDTDLAILMVDLDHFKGINDAYGHLTGDAVLREVAARLAEEIRRTDTVARFGGEEFVVLLPGAGASWAEITADRLRQRIRSTPVMVSGRAIPVTVSVGVALRNSVPGSSRASGGAHRLLAAADAALYQAKQDGRDRIVLAADVPPLRESRAARGRVRT